MIYTYADGRPITKPEIADYASAVEWLRAYHAWKDEIACVGNAAFDAQFRKSMRGAK